MYALRILFDTQDERVSIFMGSAIASTVGDWSFMLSPLSLDPNIVFPHGRTASDVAWLEKKRAWRIAGVCNDCFFPFFFFLLLFYFYFRGATQHMRRFGFTKSVGFGVAQVTKHNKNNQIATFSALMCDDVAITIACVQSNL